MEYKLTIPLSDGPSLEAKISVPADLRGKPPTMCIITHPYGTLGGDMDNHVCRSLARSLSTDHIVLRFNFRGVGDSTGRGTWRGEGEQDDMRGVMAECLSDEFLKRYNIATRPRVVLVGYSYGAMICGSVLRDFEEDIAGFVAIGYPLSVTWFLTLWRTDDVVDPLKESSSPKIFLHGEYDNYTGVKAARGLVAATKNATLHVMDGEDHFFASRRSLKALEGHVRSAVEGFLAGGQ